TLSFLENGQPRPFGAGGVFVRLLSASGAPAETAYVNGRGEFEATVAVPKGGIGDVQIGLRGFSDGKSPADVLFPITNDPMPGPAHITEPKQRASASHATAWSLAVAGGVLSAFCLLVLRRARRR